MARIRSIHPGLWTDEAFATLSMAARVLIMGIWNHADDGGGFEWKPLTLKMRIFPADNVDVAALLEELSSSNLILEYDEDGKRFGAVRNFGKWQRAQKPDRFCPMPSEIREYAGTVHVLSKEERKKNDTATGSKAKETPDNSDQSLTGTVPVADLENRREEGRKVRKEEGNTSLTSFESERAQNPKSEKSKRASRLPADWQPTPDQVQFAEASQVDPVRTAEVFRDYWLGVPGAKGCKADWDATWRNWVRREDGMRTPTVPSKAQQRADNAAAWKSGVMLEGY
ncbi:hypothetical protein [Gluconobacter kanchanaburiensis]|uniref:DnaT DNA-binding domain-containing protein n=1 Tax=Gluconobacter kanchanaburiensis NBRC 103587 TaxID=1307948 RepID=A0A511B631_9PROT|nr:hypothetical protein [Gluconobacter kanchanaburiensis]MBF0861260.1 hypothetical protein [Gluconobacter kanchanaburiensis]GBR70964.1 hypothetical protein AA103587_2148 [Gluconobacter kanchanaburiensis NBRC 103587]GEK95915.1 hypothetical protein GKA01_11120 [Gluconobacter kanchanaburiensis NBRC 103587]